MFDRGGALAVERITLRHRLMVARTNGRRPSA
jgi:hypothetical protein